MHGVDLQGHKAGAQQAVEHLARVVEGDHRAVRDLLLLQLAPRDQQPPDAYACATRNTAHFSETSCDEAP